MKKLFTLLTMLIVGIGSMWATTPVTGAYPVAGKTYYLFANKYNSTDRYHLYWDNTNSALKRADANSKDSNSDYYKWTVTVSDGKYYINNVGTGTKLAWDDSKGLTLNASGTLFDLSKDVDYSACVSLYYSNFWCCVENSAETFRNGLKFSNSFPTGNTTYSVNFVFEEVLSAHSLENGKFYTIYCDNDNKQYLYDNAGTLAQTSSAPDADYYKYIWECIVSGDNYNFRNLQTGKYLSHKAISSTANNFNIETTDVYHDGCVKLKTGSNYMGFTKDGNPDQASHARFPKITTDFSFDFRFDKVDLSSWITGDLLGGSMSGTNNWTNTWTSGTNPQFTLTSGNNDINNTDGRTQGGLDIRSGNTTAGYDTYTITAPTGYLITGYKIVGYALNGDQTVTPSKGGDATVFTTAGNSISVSGLRQKGASFKLSGANEGLFIRALQVSLAPIASITSLPTASDKAYVIHNRYTWNFANEATAMNSVANGELDLDDTKQQIAIIYYNENYYIYSINAKKFLTASNTLTDSPTTDEQISITATSDATYPWFFKFKNIADKNINIDGNGIIRINDFSTLDAGNKNAIIEAVDFDPKEAFAAVSGFNKIIAELERYPYGLGLGKYHVTDGDKTYYSEVTGIISSLKAAGYSSANLTDAQNLKDATSINLPSTGKFYRFKSNATGKYIGYAGSGSQPMVEEANAGIYYYTEGKRFLNYNQGRYLGGATGNAITAVGTEGPAFNFYETGYSTPTLGTYRIRVSDDSYGSLIDWTDDYLNGWGDGDNARCEWIIEEVTSLPVTFNNAALGYATFFAPVPLQIPANTTAYICQVGEKEVDSKTVNTLTFYEIKYIKDESDKITIPANTPVLLYNSTVSASPVPVNFPITSYEGDGIVEDYYAGSFGTLAAESFDGTNAVWVDSDENEWDIYSLRVTTGETKKAGFFKKTSGTSLAGFKAWLKLAHTDGAARNFVISFDGEGDPTGIVEALGLQNDNVEIYDLNGRKLSSYKKGINIVNGKKVMIQ